MSTQPSDTLLARRRADFWTSLVLLVLAAAMIGGALQFPLRGTYAGVRNAWYVSPALLPLIVATCLALLAIALMVTALRAGALRHAFAARGPGHGAAGRLDVVLIAGLIAAFVVCLVPRVDFVAAAGLFLLAFTVGYHVDRPALARIALGAFFATAGLVAILALVGLTPPPRSAAAFMLDAAVLAILALAVLLLVWRCDAAARRALGQCLAVALATPLLLGSIFKFLLLVPLPREGLIVVALDTARYALRGAF